MTQGENKTAAEGDSRDLDLLVIGLGYVGLPLAQAAALAGLRVAGLDVSKATVEGLNEGRSHIDDLKDADIAEMQSCGFAASDDPTIIARAHAITICVPTPLRDGRAPNLAAVRSATSTVAKHLTPGTLVVLESTTYPGTTDEVLLPMLAVGGREVGRDFFLAFSPERVDPGNPTYGIANTPKIVGGVTSLCTERATQLFGRFVREVVVANGPREAEMAKLLENTYRHVNIALINELAQVSHELNIDIWNVIDCASSKPFGFQAFYPGAGVGGHCIPIDPSYLSYRVQSKLHRSFRFVELAQEVNATMPHYVTQRVQDLLNENAKAVNGAKVLLIGVSYKPNVSDVRETPALPVAERLHGMGASLSYYDPLVTSWDSRVRKENDLRRAAGGVDIAVVLQRHADISTDELTTTATPILDATGRMTGGSVHRL